MDAVLVKVTSLKDGFIRLTLDMAKDKMTVDPFDYIDKAVDLRIPDEIKEVS
jgi:hypothetical protein